MGWLQDRASAIKKGASTAGGVLSGIGSVLTGGVSNIGNAIEKKVNPKTNIGSQISSSAAAEDAELGKIRTQMGSDYGEYAGKIDAARGKFRGEEDARDTGYDAEVDTNAAQAGGLESALASKADGLESESKTQGEDARKVYTESVRPKMQKNMESSMSLADYMDPNNKVQTGYRDMYNKQGEAARKTGLADYGILAALGGQASRGSMAGRAMTGSQMAGVQGANMGQAGVAYQRAQQRMNDLQDQGIATGIAESGKAYDAGQKATRDFTDEESRQLEIGAKGRSERQGYAGQATDLRMRGVDRSADINRGRYERNTSKGGARYGEDLGDMSNRQNFKQGISGLEREDVGRRFGTQREGDLAASAAAQANAANIRSMMTAGLASGSQVAGSYLGNKQQGGSSPAGKNTNDGTAAGTGFTNDEANPYNISTTRRSYYS